MQAILQLQDLLKILVLLCKNHGFRLKLPRVLLGEKSKRLNCVLAFLEKLRGSTVTFYTDSQNAASIILKGSRVQELQVLALTIFNSCRKN
jgi:hypothetical protein